jgi:pimeloyl-ACP methyl ester carboxylesterase
MDLAHRTARAWDGTRIAYQACGDGPAVVLANGLGGDVEAWRFVIEALGPRRKIVSWDYRGLFRSEAPRSAGTLGPREQARDLEPILAAEGIDRFVLCGWSMGVQVAFEVWRAMRPRVAGLVAVNGVPGRPFDTALASRLSRYVLPLVIAAMRRNASLVSQVTRWGADWQGLLPMLQRIGFVGPTLDGEVFRAVASQYAQMDFDAYYATMQALGAHDAWDVVETVDVPATVITGDRDVLTPTDEARRMARAIRGADLVVIEGGTHYTPVEFPSQVGSAVVGLVEKVGF